MLLFSSENPYGKNCVVFMEMYEDFKYYIHDFVQREWQYTNNAAIYISEYTTW